MNDKGFYKSKFKSFIFTITVWILIIGVLSLIFFIWGRVEEYKLSRLLNKYQIGEKYSKIITEEDLIIQKLKGPLKRDNIPTLGFTKPSIDVAKDQYIVIINKGEYLLYLYFDKNNHLIYKEAGGS